MARAGEELGKRGPSSTADGSVNQRGHCAERHSGVSDLKAELAREAALPLLGPLLRKQNHACEKTHTPQCPLQRYYNSRNTEATEVFIHR